MSDNKPTSQNFINEVSINRCKAEDIQLDAFIRKMEVSVKAGGHYLSEEQFAEITDYVAGLATQSDNNPVVIQQLEQASNLIEQLERLLDGVVSRFGLHNETAYQPPLR